MAKRKAVDDLDTERATKRKKPLTCHLQSLSDELILRILSQVSVPDLTRCQRVCKKFKIIAGDPQLWKAAYYNRFVRPRAYPLPSVRQNPSRGGHLDYSSKLSKWLHEENLVRKGVATSWKRQYKIRHNWAKGSCDVKEIPIANQAPTPPLLAHLQDSIVYTVDVVAGLRAWEYKQNRRLLASRSLETITGYESTTLPVSFALDSQTGIDAQRLAIGFEDGSYSIYSFDKTSNSFSHLYSHPRSSNGQVSAMALYSPYLFTVNQEQTLSLYHFAPADSSGTLPNPRLLSSLRSQTVWPPMSLSLRRNNNDVLASVAYCLPTFHSSWSMGIQELLFDEDGTVTQSRLASALPQGFTPLSSSSAFSRGIGPHRLPPAASTLSRPTSISYSHPYCLVSHSDNTLTSYLVTSTASALSVGPGRRLWGHTSSVFGAQVGIRGKAISVSTRGDEVRIWELERTGYGRSSESGSSSVRVTPEKPRSSPVSPTAPAAPSPTDGGDTAAVDLDLVSRAIADGNKSGFTLALESRENGEEMMVTKGWVGFDDENVVVVRGQGQGRQALMVYDFT